MPPVLYHVTTAKSAVMQSGVLKSRSDLEQDFGKGLGGGENETISFTEDLAVAKGIKRAFLEAKKVASGEITIEDMINEAYTGYDKPFINEFLDYYDYQGNRNGSIPASLENLINGKTIHKPGMPLPVEEAQERWGENVRPLGDPAGTSQSYWQYEETLSPEKLRENTFDVYKAFAAFRERAGGPLDPLFFLSDIGHFATLPEKEVAILKLTPKTGAMGYKVSALGEWRTYEGSTLDIVDIL